jgi:hypothetical protein
MPSKRCPQGGGDPVGEQNERDRAPPRRRQRFGCAGAATLNRARLESEDAREQQHRRRGREPDRAGP